MKKTVISSDILEQQFGPTNIEVLYQSGYVRIICTKAVATGQILELSQVYFIKPTADSFMEVHESIVRGQSMGKAFRQQNIEFVRKTNYIYCHRLPGNFSRLFGSQDPASVVAVSILVGPTRAHYANILETYSPSVVWPYSTSKATKKQLAELQQFNSLLTV